MNKNIFDAIDTDNLGVLDANQVEIFVRSFLRGNQKPGSQNTDFESNHDQLLGRLWTINNENEISLEELSKFMQELLKQQIRMLQVRLEDEKYARAMKNKALDGKH